SSATVAIGGISQTGSGAVATSNASGDINVTGAVNTGGSGSTTLITSTSGDIALGANVGNASAATVLTSAGNITGTGLVSGTDVPLDSVTGVGTGTSGRVNTAADTLAARSTTSGGVFVKESNAVTLDVLGAANRAAGAAAYDVTAGGTITFSGVVNPGVQSFPTRRSSELDIALGANVGNASAATVLTSAG